jgi:hypothetical protein
MHFEIDGILILSTDFSDKSSHQIHENTPIGSRVVPYGQTDGTRDEANSLFSLFCKRA